MSSSAEVLQFPEGNKRVKADISEGYTRTANLLQDALCEVDLTGRQHRVVNSVIRCTYGYQLKTRHMKAPYIANRMKYKGDSSNIRSDVRKLKQRGILIEINGELGVNPVVSDWQLEPTKNESKSTRSKTNQNESKTTRQRVENYSVEGQIQPPIKETSKEKKKNISVRKSKPEEFKEFYVLYPDHRKGGTDQTAWKKWQSLKLTVSDALAAIHWLKLAATNQPETWGKLSQGKYCKGITKFIGEKHWLTPVPAAQVSQTAQTINDFNHDDTSWVELAGEMM